MPGGVALDPDSAIPSRMPSDHVCRLQGRGISVLSEIRASLLRSSRLTHAVEKSSSGREPGEVCPIRRQGVVFAQRNIGNILKGLTLHLSTDRLLGLDPIG